MGEKKMVNNSKKIADFFSIYPLKIYDNREVVIHPQMPLLKVFYIVEGRVSQYDITSAGSEVVVNVFKSGAFFPMSTAINGTRNLYYFEASTEVIAHVAPPDDVVQFLKDNPEITFDLLSRVYLGVDGALRRMAHLMGGDSESRLLFELLNAAYRFGEQQEDGSILLPLKEGDIARHSGLARETVNRNIQNLKNSGLVSVEHNSIRITDTQKLEAILDAKL